MREAVSPCEIDKKSSCRTVSENRRHSGGKRIAAPVWKPARNDSLLDNKKLPLKKRQLKKQIVSRPEPRP